MTALLSTAFAAGMVATVNPCGFAMLPAYLGFFLGDGTERRVERTGVVALSVASGFLVVFTLAGALISFGLRTVVDTIPWLALAVGLGLIVVGIAQLLGRRLLPTVPGVSRARKSGSVGGMFVFGVSYAIASLSCTLPIFLSLVGGIVSAEALSTSVLAFTAYGAGMATAVTGVTFVVAGGKKTVLAKIRRLARHMDTISGVVMTVAGVFIVWYWATILSGGGVALGSTGLVRWIDRTSASVTGFLADNAGLVAVVIGAIAVLGWLWGRSAKVASPTEWEASEHSNG
ncbi:MAG: cytochrome c biogenesis CcdA family protein [Acidimicrobiia bacterium]